MLRRLPSTRGGFRVPFGLQPGSELGCGCRFGQAPFAGRYLRGLLCRFTYLSVVQSLGVGPCTPFGISLDVEVGSLPCTCRFRRTSIGLSTTTRDLFGVPFGSSPC